MSKPLPLIDSLGACRSHDLVGARDTRVHKLLGTVITHFKFQSWTAMSESQPTSFASFTCDMAKILLLENSKRFSNLKAFVTLNAKSYCFRDFLDIQNFEFCISSCEVLNTSGAKHGRSSINDLQKGGNPSSCGFRVSSPFELDGYPPGRLRKNARTVTLEASQKITTSINIYQHLSGCQMWEPFLMEQNQWKNMPKRTTSSALQCLPFRSIRSFSQELWSSVLKFGQQEQHEVSEKNHQFKKITYQSFKNFHPQNQNIPKSWKTHVTTTAQLSCFPWHPTFTTQLPQACWQRFLGPWSRVGAHPVQGLRGKRCNTMLDLEKNKINIWHFCWINTCGSRNILWFLRIFKTVYVLCVERCLGADSWFLSPCLQNLVPIGQQVRELGESDESVMNPPTFGRKCDNFFICLELKRKNLMA